MPGFTGSDVKSLRGAYNNIYANQNDIEFTEDQFIEHFEYWVDSLVENGYNLNDHTFDEIYEVYLNENWRQLGTQARKQLDRAGGAIWKGVTTAASATSEFGKGLITGKEKDEPPSTPPITKTKPSSGVKVDLRLPSVQQFVNPKWWAPDRPATTPSTAKTKYRVDASGRMVRSEEIDIEEQTRVRARQTKGGKSVFGSVETKGGKPVPGSFKPATGSTADIKKAEVEYNIARNERQRRLAQSDPNAYFGTSKPPAPSRTPPPVVNPPDSAAPRRDSEPATTKPKPTPKPPTPAPTPFSKSVSAPPAASLDKYKINKDWAAANPRLAQAQVARASGQPRADINKILYKPGTAAYGASGKSEMEKQVDQMRQDREKMAKQREADKIGPQAQSALPGGAYSPTATANMTQRTRNILGVKEQHDAYDLVLEYLFSQGHVDTLEEALYVMMEMPAETIQSIIEQSNTLVTPEQRRADELKYGMRRTTQVPPSKPPATVKTGPKPPRMPL